MQRRSWRSTCGGGGGCRWRAPEYVNAPTHAGMPKPRARALAPVRVHRVPARAPTRLPHNPHARAARPAAAAAAAAAQAMLSDIWRWRRRGGFGESDEDSMPHVQALQALQVWGGARALGLVSKQGVWA